ncbi:MAG TPA: class I SAM-dependent methyltransferase [Stellaceae bacterium]|nr:class I SAM-dependent methyltransferase [Stellaceae bacterium]
MSDVQIAPRPDAHAYGLAPAPEALRYDWGNDEPAEVAGILHTMMPSNARVLDVGCGTGAVTLIANRGKNNELWGIEPEPERARLAGVRGIRVTCGTLDRAFVEGHPPFDVVMLADVLEHVAAPGELLERAASAVKPDGLVLLSVPNAAHWTMRLHLLYGRFDYAETGIRDATHLRWFTEKTIRALCRHCGLEVVAMRHSAGNDLPEYRRHLPWRLLPGRVRRPLVRRLTRAAPRLFGCQHVVAAKPRG